MLDVSCLIWSYPAQQRSSWISVRDFSAGKDKIPWTKQQRAVPCLSLKAAIVLLVFWSNPQDSPLSALMITLCNGGSKTSSSCLNGLLQGLSCLLRGASHSQSQSSSQHFSVSFSCGCNTFLVASHYWHHQFFLKQPWRWKKSCKNTCQHCSVFSFLLYPACVSFKSTFIVNRFDPGVTLISPAVSGSLIGGYMWCPLYLSANKSICVEGVCCFTAASSTFIHRRQ